MYNIHYSEKFRSLKNPKFYLYSNQIEFLAINYPKFMKNNVFIKNDVQIKFFEYILNIDLLQDDDLVILTNKGLLIENKNILIPKVKYFSFTDNYNILICYISESINSLKVIKLKDNNYEIIDSIEINQKNIYQILKISNNRFITYGDYNILLWKMDENNSLKFLSNINELTTGKKLKEILFLTNNKNIITLNEEDFHILKFWKINDDNKIEKIAEIEINGEFCDFIDYDNDILIVKYDYHILYFINLNNFQIIHQENKIYMFAMKKLMNGNILFCVEGKIGYDIIEYKFNKIKCELIEFKIIPNAHYSCDIKILEMKNCNLITYENNFIVIWNKNNEFNKIND